MVEMSSSASALTANAAGPCIRFWLIARRKPLVRSETNGAAQESVIEYDTIETAADRFERGAGGAKDLPQGDWDLFLEHCRQAREEEDRLDDVFDQP